MISKQAVLDAVGTLPDSATGHEVTSALLDLLAREQTGNGAIAASVTSLSAVDGGAEAVDSEALADDFKVHIAPSAFLRTCWLLFWNALRHPFRTTEIDMVTGQVIHRN